MGPVGSNDQENKGLLTLFTTPHEIYQGLMGNHSQTIKSTLNLLWNCYHNYAKKTMQIKIEVAPEAVQCNFHFFCSSQLKTVYGLLYFACIIVVLKNVINFYLLY